MSAYEVIGVTVVRTEHHHVGTLGNEWTEQRVVLGGTALADDNLHAGIDARASFLQRRTLMIGGDACPCIQVTLASCESWCVTVNRLSVTLRSLDFLHHFLIASQHSGIVHHLCQETNILASHEFLRVFGINHGSAGFNIAAYSRHTTGSTKAEVEARFAT